MRKILLSLLLIILVGCTKTLPKSITINLPYDSVIHEITQKNYVNEVYSLLSNKFYEIEPLEIEITDTLPITIVCNFEEEVVTYTIYKDNIATIENSEEIKYVLYDFEIYNALKELKQYVEAL